MEFPLYFFHFLFFLFLTSQKSSCWNLSTIEYNACAPRDKKHPPALHLRLKKHCELPPYTLCLLLCTT